MYARQMYDKCQLSILLITSVRPFPVPRQKVLFQRDLRFDRDVNNQTLREDRLISVQMFNMFCLVWRYFRSSQKVFQTFFFIILVVLHESNVWIIWLDLINQTLWDDRPMCVHVFTLFCFIRRNFRSSPEAIQKIVFSYFIYFTWNEYISMFNRFFLSTVTSGSHRKG